MGLFSVHGRLPRPAEQESPTRPHAEDSLARAGRRIGALPGRLALAARAAIRNTGNEAATGLRDLRLAMVAATDDARIVAVLLLLAAVALGLEMAASFHLI
jgi:hypothetical protein